MLSVIIPALNRERPLADLVSLLKHSELVSDVIVVDGGSHDGSRASAVNHGARVIAAPRGRGQQLAIGAAVATGASWLLFLHADSRPGPGWEEAITHHMCDANRDRAAVFRLAFDDTGPEARRLERIVAWRTRALALPYGDQGLLISRHLYNLVGGFRPMALMEDVDIVRRIGRERLSVLDAFVVTSAERYRRDGWKRRSARNAFCLSLYFAGIPPKLIRKIYG